MAGFLAAGSHDALTGLRWVAGSARIARTLSRRGGPKGWSCEPHADEAGNSCGCENSPHLSSLADMGSGDALLPWSYGSSGARDCPVRRSFCGH